jgi:hypothetical protein
MSQLLSNISQWSANFANNGSNLPVSAGNAVTSANSSNAATSNSTVGNVTDLWNQLYALSQPGGLVQGAIGNPATPAQQAAQNQANDPNPCPAFSITDPMPSIQCNIKKDIVYITELFLLLVLTLYGLKLLFPAVSDRVRAFGDSAKKTAETTADVGAAVLA